MSCRRLLSYATNMSLCQRLYPHILAFTTSSQTLAMVVVDHVERGWDLYEIADGESEPMLAAITRKVNA